MNTIEEREFIKELKSLLEKELQDYRNMRDCVRELSKDILYSMRRIEALNEVLNYQVKRMNHEHQKAEA